MNIIEKQSNKFSFQLTTNDLEVIQFIYKQYSNIPNMKIKELADACFTSSSTLHRVLKKLGFEGFSDFKYKITADLEHTSSKNFNHEEYLQKTLSNIELTK